MEKEREGIQANNNYMEQTSSAQWHGKEGGPHEGWGRESRPKKYAQNTESSKCSREVTKSSLPPHVSIKSLEKPPKTVTFKKPPALLSHYFLQRHVLCGNLGQRGLECLVYLFLRCEKGFWEPWAAGMFFSHEGKHLQTGPWKKKSFLPGYNILSWFVLSHLRLVAKQWFPPRYHFPLRNHWSPLRDTMAPSRQMKNLILIFFYSNQ